MSDTVEKTGLDSTGIDTLLARVRARRLLPAADERRRIREEAGVSQRELAKALGTSWTSVQRWEEGARPRKHESAYAQLLDELRHRPPAGAVREVDAAVPDVERADVARSHAGHVGAPAAIGASRKRP